MALIFSNLLHLPHIFPYFAIFAVAFQSFPGSKGSKGSKSRLQQLSDGCGVLHRRELVQRPPRHTQRRTPRRCRRAGVVWRLRSWGQLDSLKELWKYHLGDISIYKYIYILCYIYILYIYIYIIYIYIILYIDMPLNGIFTVYSTIMYYS